MTSCVLTEKRQKGALIPHANKWGVSRLKPVLEFAPLKLKLTASVGTFKTDKVQSQAPSNFFHFERCNYWDSFKKLIFAF